MNLDLRAFSCRSFEIQAWINDPSLDLEEVQRFINTTHNELLKIPGEDEEEVCLGLFMSLNHVGDSRVLSSGSFSASLTRKGLCQLGMSFETWRTERRPQFGTGAKAMKRLLDWLHEQFGSITVQSRTFFQYQESSGFESLIELPSPLLTPTAQFSHVEGLTLGFRDGKGTDPLYSVEIIPEEQSVVHRIERETEITMTRRGLLETLQLTSDISRQLVKHKERPDNDDSG